MALAELAAGVEFSLRHPGALAVFNVLFTLYTIGALLLVAALWGRPDIPRWSLLVAGVGLVLIPVAGMVAATNSLGAAAALVAVGFAGVSWATRNGDRCPSANP